MPSRIYWSCFLGDSPLLITSVANQSISNSLSPSLGPVATRSRERSTLVQQSPYAVRRAPLRGLQASSILH